MEQFYAFQIMKFLPLLALHSYVFFCLQDTTESMSRLCHRLFATGRDFCTIFRFLFQLSLCMIRSLALAPCSGLQGITLLLTVEPSSLYSTVRIHRCYVEQCSMFFGYPQEACKKITSQIRSDSDRIARVLSISAKAEISESPEDRFSGTMYKRVDQKIKPVAGTFPEFARVTRQFPEDPLLTLPILTPHPPEFKPTERISEEGIKMLLINEEGWLWPEEIKLFQHIMVLNQDALAFEEDQRGTFKESYFSPYIIPVEPHTPWVYKNIPIPPGIKDKVIQLLKDKMKAGVYEHSQSAYRSRWFCVLKKNGKLRIVHDLQPLNKVTIRDAGLPPIVDDFVEPFAAKACTTVFDLFWGFDGRKVHPDSRDLTAFLTPLGALRLTSMPMGFTNSVAEFQNSMVFILQDEIPDKANIFIDDLGISGPDTIYPDENGKPEVLKDNPGIRRFIWEHAVDVHRIMHRMKHAGGTFSPNKAQICRKEVVIVGQKCTPDGRKPEDKKVEKILKWPALASVKEVRGFLGLCGTVRIWIPNYSQIARPLTELVRKNTEFIWDNRRERAFNTLKQLVSSAPALRPIDYESENPIILSVDSSYIAVGFILSQLDDEGRRRPARYGSLPMSEVESRYSQPKLELFGLYRALRHYRLYIIGVKNLYVEVDAKYIKGMLNSPDLQPNAAINRWIQGILLFDFTLVHVPAERFKAEDALSRRRLGKDEEPEFDDDSWLESITYHIGGVGKEYPLGVIQKTRSYQVEDLPSTFAAAISQEENLQDIFKFLKTLQYPEYVKTTQDDRRFIQKATKFFIQKDSMFKRNGDRPPLKVIFDKNQRLDILSRAHEGLGHRGEQAVFETIRIRFFWPHMFNDVRHHVRSCHECQIRSTKRTEVPLTISTPSTVWSKIYVDIMLMPLAKGYRYIVAARDDLTRASEGRALRRADSKSLMKFFWEQIYCRYGAVGEVITDNGSEVKGAFKLLLERMEIPQITISPYNSKANGVVERGHFIIRESIVKACEGNITKWPEKVQEAFFADKITTSKVTGFSPYYLLHGVHPVLPFDLTESTFMVKGFKSGMSRADLLALRMRQIQKRQTDLDRAAAQLTKFRIRSKEKFEKKFQKRMRSGPFDPGDLVLVRHTEIEKSLDRKAKPRYRGPYQIVRRNQGGAYILSELSGEIMREKYAAFRILPYIARDRKAQRIIQAKYRREDTESEDSSLEEED